MGTIAAQNYERLKKNIVTKNARGKRAIRKAGTPDANRQEKIACEKHPGGKYVQGKQAMGVWSWHRSFEVFMSAIPSGDVLDTHCTSPVSGTLATC